MDKAPRIFETWIIPFWFYLALFIISTGCENRNLPAEVMAIHQPAPGEIIYSGVQYPVQWNLPAWPTVDINLCNQEGDAWPIASEIPNSGSFFWQIPAEIPDASDYSVLISDPSDPDSGIRGGPFEIRSMGEMSSLTDSRDGQTYKTVKIGAQWWMAENFTLDCAGSHYYRNNESNGLVYGRLYTLEAALENCPPGWHLPSDSDWKQLEAYLGIMADEIDNFGERGLYAGTLLGRGGGTGFEALYGGYYNSCVGKDAHRVWESHFWTSSKTPEGKPLIRVITRQNGGVMRMATLCHGGCAVRYIKKAEAD
jgi:uncharacterized protein (TIGR02145 family)